MKKHPSYFQQIPAKSGDSSRSERPRSRECLRRPTPKLKSLLRSAGHVQSIQVFCRGFSKSYGKVSCLFEFEKPAMMGVYSAWTFLLLIFVLWILA